MPDALLNILEHAWAIFLAVGPMPFYNPVGMFTIQRFYTTVDKPTCVLHCCDFDCDFDYDPPYNVCHYFPTVTQTSNMYIVHRIEGCLLGFHVTQHSTADEFIFDVIIGGVARSRVTLRPGESELAMWNLGPIMLSNLMYHEVCIRIIKRPERKSGCKLVLVYGRTCADPPQITRDIGFGPMPRTHSTEATEYWEGGWFVTGSGICAQIPADQRKPNSVVPSFIVPTCPHELFMAGPCALTRRCVPFLDDAELKDEILKSMNEFDREKYMSLISCIESKYRATVASQFRDELIATVIANSASK